MNATELAKKLDWAIERQSGDHPRDDYVSHYLGLLYIARAVVFLADELATLANTVDRHLGDLAGTVLVATLDKSQPGQRNE